jgi:hypothetical protein
MIRLGFTYEIKTERGIAFSSVDCEIECEYGLRGEPSMIGVYIDKENLLLSKDVLLLALACEIAGEAENSPRIIEALREEAEEVRLEHRAGLMWTGRTGNDPDAVFERRIG